MLREKFWVNILPSLILKLWELFTEQLQRAEKTPEQKKSEQQSWDKGDLTEGHQVFDLRDPCTEVHWSAALVPRSLSPQTSNHTLNHFKKNLRTLKTLKTNYSIASQGPWRLSPEDRAKATKQKHLSWETMVKTERVDT